MALFYFHVKKRARVIAGDVQSIYVNCTMNLNSNTNKSAGINLLCRLC